MAARPSWEGHLTFNLVSIPVKAFNAVGASPGKIGFHLLHKGCNERIRYKKVCPVHGEVTNDEIVSGYEYQKGQYVTVGKDEKGGLKEEDDKAISIDTFVAPAAIDPIYFSGRTYYLVPNGPAAQKPYAVMFEAMRAHEKIAVARLVLSGRGHVAVVRPFGKLLGMTLLAFEDEVKSPAPFEAEVGSPSVSAKERDLAEALLDSATSRLRPHPVQGRLRREAGQAGGRQDPAEVGQEWARQGRPGQRPDGRPAGEPGPAGGGAEATGPDRHCDPAAGRRGGPPGGAVVSLADYRKKRRFAETPEPAGGRGAGRGPLRFVVQKHDATPAALRLPPGTRRRAEELGGAQGPVPRPGRQATGGDGRGPPARLRRRSRGSSRRGTTGPGRSSSGTEGTYHAAGAGGPEAGERLLADGLAQRPAGLRAGRREAEGRVRPGEAEARASRTPGCWSSGRTRTPSPPT